MRFNELSAGIRVLGQLKWFCGLELELGLGLGTIDDASGESDVGGRGKPGSEWEVETASGLSLLLGCMRGHGETLGVS